MQNVQEIEKKFYEDKKSVTGDELFELSKYYYQKRLDFSEDENESPRKNLKDASSLSMKAVHLGIEAYRAGAKDRVHLEFYKELLSKYKFKLSHNNYLTKVIVELRKIDGVKEPEILKKVLGSGFVEGGILALRDKSFDQDFLDCDYHDFDKLIKHGKGVVFSTGGDGSVGLQIRLVDGEIPSISDKEYKISPVSTKEYVIDLPSGELVFSDLGLEGVEAKVDPGIYTCIIYCIDIPDKFFGYYAVLCKTDKKPENKLAYLVTLEPHN